MWVLTYFFVGCGFKGSLIFRIFAVLFWYGWFFWFLGLPLVPPGTAWKTKGAPSGWLPGIYQWERSIWDPCTYAIGFPGVSRQSGELRPFGIQCYQPTLIVVDSFSGFTPVPGVSWQEKGYSGPIEGRALWPLIFGGTLMDMWWWFTSGLLEESCFIWVPTVLGWKLGSTTPSCLPSFTIFSEFSWCCFVPYPECISVLSLCVCWGGGVEGGQGGCIYYILSLHMILIIAPYQ